MYVTKVLVVLDIEEAFILTEFSIAKLDSVWWFEWGTTYICSWRAKLNSSPLLHANMSLSIKCPLFKPPHQVQACNRNSSEHGGFQYAKHPTSDQKSSWI